MPFVAAGPRAVVVSSLRGGMSYFSRRPIFRPLVLWFCGLYLGLAGLDGQLPWPTALLGGSFIWAGVSMRWSRP